MTDEAVLRAITSATRNAFDLGRRSARPPGNKFATEQAAQQFAEGLIMPMVQMRVDEAIEAVDIARLRSQLAERASQGTAGGA